MCFFLITIMLKSLINCSGYLPGQVAAESVGIDQTASKLNVVGDVRRVLYKSSQAALARSVNGIR